MAPISLGPQGAMVPWGFTQLSGRQIQDEFHGCVYTQTDSGGKIFTEPRQGERVWLRPITPLPGKEFPRNPKNDMILCG